ncbi:MAG: hypothetical protein ACF8TS_19135 [Maioricimonas sp. JB049]
MIDPLQFLWPAVEAVKPVFARAAIVRWPAGVHGQLVAAGLLVPQDTTTRIRCPECGQTHIAKPYARQQPDGTSRFFIPCPQNLRAEVKTRDLQQWAASIDALVSALATWMQLGGKPASLDSDRVWRCGRWNYQGVLRDVLFARGLRRRDAIQFRRAITGAHRPIVFVGSEIPDADFWQGRVPPLIRLREVATFVDAKIEIDVTQLIGLVRAADESEPETTLTLDQLKTLVRQQVKAEGKTALKDDLLVSARKQCGSLRKAAKFLSDESGQTVTKDQVAAAVKRKGGIAAVMRDDDSESVVRTVSSRRRDTPIKKRDSSK